MENLMEKVHKVEQDFQLIFKSLKKSYSIDRNSSVKKRINKLKALRSWILINRGKINSAIYRDLKKPFAESDLTEIRAVLSEIRKALNGLSDWVKPQKIDTPISYLGTKAEVRYEPKGVVLIIAPWNYPFNLTIAPLVSAIAAGNNVIIHIEYHIKHPPPQPDHCLELLLQVL